MMLHYYFLTHPIHACMHACTHSFFLSHKTKNQKSKKYIYCLPSLATHTKYYHKRKKTLVFQSIDQSIDCDGRLQLIHSMCRPTTNGSWTKTHMCFWSIVMVVSRRFDEPIYNNKKYDQTHMQNTCISIDHDGSYLIDSMSQSTTNWITTNCRIFIAQDWRTVPIELPTILLGIISVKSSWVVIILPCWSFTLGSPNYVTKSKCFSDVTVITI